MIRKKHDELDERYLEIMELAESGNPVAMEAAGRAYLMGDTGFVSEEDAERLLRAAAEAGHTPSMHLYWSLVVSRGLATGNRDLLPSAMEFEQQAAARAYPEAMLAGLMSGAGQMPVEDYKVAQFRLMDLAPRYALFWVFDIAVERLSETALADHERMEAEVGRLRERLAGQAEKQAAASARVAADSRSASRELKDARDRNRELADRIAALSASSLEARVREAEVEADRIRSEAAKQAHEARQAVADARRDSSDRIAAAMVEKEAARREAGRANALVSDMDRRISYLEALLRENGIPFNVVMGHARKG